MTPHHISETPGEEKERERERESEGGSVDKERC
jgi:hypothetical protein